MAPEDPTQKGEDLFMVERSNTPDREPFEADLQSVPEARGSCQELLFGRAVEVWQAFIKGFIVVFGACLTDLVLISPWRSLCQIV